MRAHVIVPCVILEAHEEYSSVQKLPTAISSDAYGGGIAVGVTRLVRLTTV